MSLELAHRQNLTPLLHARSVAIVGLSQPGRFGGQVYANLRDFGYQGHIYGINPRYQSLYDQPCYPSLSDLPQRPDCAVLAVANERLEVTLSEAVELGIPAAVIFASAYAAPENGQPPLQQRLATLAQQRGMVICGPNGMGFFSLGQRLALSGYQSIPTLPSGSVAMISHSGSIWDALLQNRRQVYFNYAVSSGNEMVTTLADYMQFALTDPDTHVMALFLETVRDPQTFVAALAEAAERDVPVVALKIGRSRRGAVLAQAHSGALAGEDAAYDALFAHYGVCRVKSPDEMMDTLELFAAKFRPPTRYLSAVFDSGGERGLAVDLAEAEGVDFTPIVEATTARLAEVLDPGLDPVNPLDAWGTGHNFEQIYQDCLLGLDADPLTGLTLLAVDLCTVEDFSLSYVNIATAIQPHLQKPLAILTHLTSAAGEVQVAYLRQHGIPVLMGTETGLRAVRHLLAYSEFQRGMTASQTFTRSVIGSGPFSPPNGGISVFSPVFGGSGGQLTYLRRQLTQAVQPLDEYASKQILRTYGLTTPLEHLAESLAEVFATVEVLGYPVALKTAAGDLHKSDRNGVRLNLSDASQLTAAYQDIAGRLGPRVLVQQMVPVGVELLVGMVHDAQFGPMLVVGTGGIWVEVFKDSRWLLLPTTPDAVREALLSLCSAPLLQGLRGQPPVDLEAVVETVMRLAAFIADAGDLIAEIDLNPVIVLPDRTVVVDAVIVPKKCSS